MTQSYNEYGLADHLPENWRITSCREIAVEKTTKNQNGVSDAYLSLVANVGVMPYEEKGDVGNKKPEDLSKCKMVSVGDLVINSMNYGIGSFGLSQYDGVCSPVYIVLKPIAQVVEERFALRVFENKSFQKYAQSYGNGILDHRAAINWDILKNLKIGLPPQDEQQRILAFLDAETAKIDALIQEQEKLLSLLAANKKAIIFHAVTNGLDASVATKIADIDWLGQIPAHWDVKRIKELIRIKKTLVGSDSDKYLLLSLTLQGIVPRDMENPKGKFPAEFDAYQTVDKNDLVFCLFDVEETPRTVGISRYSGMITGAYTVATSVPNSPVFQDFLYYFYLAFDQYKGLKKYYTGLRNVIRKDAFMNLRCPIPPYDEQLSICEHIESELQKNHKLVLATERAVELLQERRSALISAAVTGKIDVRNYQAKEAS